MIAPSLESRSPPDYTRFVEPQASVFERGWGCPVASGMPACDSRAGPYDAGACATGAASHADASLHRPEGDRRHVLHENAAARYRRLRPRLAGGHLVADEGSRTSSGRAGSPRARRRLRAKRSCCRRARGRRVRPGAEGSSTGLAGVEIEREILSAVEVRQAERGRRRRPPRRSCAPNRVGMPHVVGRPGAGAGRDAKGRDAVAAPCFNQHVLVQNGRLGGGVGRGRVRAAPQELAVGH